MFFKKITYTICRNSRSFGTHDGDWLQSSAERVYAHYENARAAVQAHIRPATRDNLKSKSDEILFSINRDSRNKRCGSSSEQ